MEVRMGKITTVVGIGVVLSGCRTPQSVHLDTELARYINPSRSSEYVRHFGVDKNALSEEDKRSIFRTWEKLLPEERDCLVRVTRYSTRLNFRINNSEWITKHIGRMVYWENKFLNELKVKAPKIVEKYDTLQGKDRTFINMEYLNLGLDMEDSRRLLSQRVSENIEAEHYASNIFLRTLKSFDEDSKAHKFLTSLISREVKKDGSGYRGEFDRVVIADFIASFDRFPKDLRYKIIEILLNGFVENVALRERIGTQKGVGFGIDGNPLTQLVYYAYRNPKLVKISPLLLVKAFTEISDYSNLFEIDWDIFNNKTIQSSEVSMRSDALAAFEYQWAKKIRELGGDTIRLSAAIQPYATWFFNSEPIIEEKDRAKGFSSLPRIIYENDVATADFKDPRSACFVLLDGFNPNVISEIKPEYKTSSFKLFPLHSDFNFLLNKQDLEMRHLVVACNPSPQEDYLGRVDPVISENGDMKIRLSNIKWLVHGRDGIKVIFVCSKDVPLGLQQILKRRTNLHLDFRQKL